MEAHVTRAGKATPQPVDGVFLFLSCFMLFWYVGGMLGWRNPAREVIIAQYGFVLLPVLLYVRLAGFNVRSTFALHTMSFRTVALVALTVSAGTILILAAVLIQRVLFPWTTRIEKEFERQLMPLIRLGPIQVLFLLAITPALCEEMMFRGFVLAAFRRKGRWIAILMSSLLFGVLHLNPARFLPTFLLGVLLAYLVLETHSLWAGMVGHAVHNTIGICLQRFVWTSPARHIVLGTFLLLLPLATVLFCFGLRLLWKPKP